MFPLMLCCVGNNTYMIDWNSVEAATRPIARRSEIAQYNGFLTISTVTVVFPYSFQHRHSN